MNSLKYKYWKIDRGGLSGNTNLKGCIGKSVDVNGCTVLLCTDGYALISINFKQYKISKGNFIFLPLDIFPYHVIYQTIYHIK